MTRLLHSREAYSSLKMVIGTSRAAVILLALVAHGASGQSISRDSTSGSAAAKQSAPDSTPPWVTRRDLLALGAAALASVAVAPLDRPVANELQDNYWQKDEPIHSASQALAFAGGPGPFLLSAGLFTAGKLVRSSALSGAGLHISESVLLAAALTGLGKGIAGRALPGVQTSENFQLGRGFHSGNGAFVSFPSGHTAAAFAVASALTVEVNAWHPGLERYVGPSAYLAASAIGLARLYQHVHWVSDLPLAAAIGTWSGLAVESHVHQRKRATLVEGIAESASVGVTPDGRTFVGWSICTARPSH